MRVLRTLVVLALLVLVAALSPAGHERVVSAQPAAAHAVSAEEAAAVADLWLAAEGLSPAARQSPAVWALLAEDLLLPAGQAGAAAPALAYVVVYQPAGYAVVAGDDRIEPVLAFATDAPFRWDQPERNFMRHYLNTEVPNRYEALAVQGVEAVHPTWTALRTAPEAVQRALDPPGLPQAAPAQGTTEVLWDTAAWDQGQFYNATVVANNGNTADVPTGCTATAMAIKMRFHQWPATGNSSHSYSDTWGAVRYNHSVTFSSQTYTWANMPATDLTAANAAVANLMYHAGVAVDMDYEVGWSGAWPTTASMNSFFRYRGTTEITSDHDDPIRDSVLAGLPVVLSSSAHTVLADGYRDTVAPFFHLNLGWGGNSDGWYSLSTIPVTDPTIDRSYPYSAPSNFVYVDKAWAGTENGDLDTPYNSVVEGAGAVPAGGQLWIKAGSYTGTGNLPITISTAMTIKSWNGLVTIGTP